MYQVKKGAVVQDSGGLGFESRRGEILLQLLKSSTLREYLKGTKDAFNQCDKSNLQEFFHNPCKSN